MDSLLKKKNIYIERSIQNYFIKFCESHITSEDLEEKLSKISSPIKALKLEIEYRKGNWDICDENEDQQSRVGEYVIVHRIL